MSVIKHGCQLAGAIVVGMVIATAGPVLAGDAGTEFMQAMTTMNKAMSKAPMTGNPDHDFAAMMVPHHQGAIDMAKIELRYGKDKMLRKLATEIVAGQEKERKMMTDWLAKPGSMKPGAMKPGAMKPGAMKPGHM